MSLVDEVFDLLVADEADGQVAGLAMAALKGPDAFEAVLQGADAEAAASRPRHPVDIPSAYLASIEATGFRGIGPTSRLDLPTRPGLTVVVGRNGSGKSSFFEALEVLLTGDSYRWKHKPAEWKQGWRNLHQPAGSRVSARFVVEGSRGATVMTRSWNDDAREASEGETLVQPHGSTKTDLTGYGWAEAIELHRPLLSHAELGIVADNPSSLFDALAAALGLDELAAASELIRKRRLELEKPLKDLRKKLTDDLLPDLRGSDDERAMAGAAALAGRTWDLRSVESLVAGVAAPPDSIDRLDSLARLTVPDADVVEQAASSIERDADRLAELRGTESHRSRQTVLLLETALAEHAEHGDQPCPVCGVGGLDAKWRARAETQVAELRRLAADYDAATSELNEAVHQGRALIRDLPPELLESPVDIDVSPVRASWDRWAAAPDTPTDLADHLRRRHPELVAAVEALAKTAASLKAAREDAWRPLAHRLASWLGQARDAMTADTQAKQLKTAGEALDKAALEIRRRRFQPISEASIGLWQSLRLQSNVELTGVELLGKGTRRRVDLSVAVDGSEGAALGVVSQGEVNCLALSLFFPRVMLPDSPFRFIIIDDPVQAMDPARVDGLAKVFAQVAETRQLVVFTHDDRLPASLQRLDLPHTTLEVTRRPGSVVEVRSLVDPVNQYFIDARAVERDDKLPDGVVSRVVPGFCRSGIEAACIEAVRRRRIGRGDSHLAVEQELAAVKGTTALAAMALFDDPSRGGAVLGEINRKWGRTAGDVYKDCNVGAHKGFKGSLVALVDEAQRLAAGLRGMR